MRDRERLAVMLAIERDFSRTMPRGVRPSPSANTISGRFAPQHENIPLLGPVTRRKIEKLAARPHKAHGRLRSNRRRTA